MASVTATINVQINAANAAAQLAALNSKVASMNKGMLAATAGGVMAQEKAIRRMGTVLSGSGMFTTGIRNVHTELGRMHQEFDRGTTTLQKYRQNSKAWGKDHSAINRMAADRVRMLQTQYVALGKEMNGVQKAMAIKPDHMMREFGADAMYATQQQMLFRRNLQMGSTALVNWGKNTQWAGRQMMVGMGIPIAIMAAGAIKSFNDIEKASIAFKRVYGDTATSVSEKAQMLSTVQKGVAKDMMQYGISMADTLDVAAKAAATGAQGADLIAATRETMRLATLGNMDYQKALESTIAMQTAFGISAGQMGKKTDFLNAVENQTILSMEDMALAVPRVAPVIKGLGGGIEELAIMMTALRQGGVTAEQGANALKSGLASMINPTATATEALGNMGINLDKIVKANKGDIIGTVKGLGKALEGLSKFQRQQALESLFGKYQYARMGALLKNINSKAVKETMRLAKAPASELAKMSAQELSQISSSPMIKLKKSIEELKAAAAPLGAVFSDIGAKIISFITPVVKFFSTNSIAKWGLIATAGIAALAGTFTMIIGVLANFAGSMVKAGMAVKSFFRFITGQKSLAYVTTDELEASAAANSLATAAERAAGGMMAEAKAAQLLTSQLEALIAAQTGAAATTRRPGPGAAPGAAPGGVPIAPTGTGPGGPVIAAPRQMPGILPVGTDYKSQQVQQLLGGYERAHLYRPTDILPGSQLYSTIQSKLGSGTQKKYANLRADLSAGARLKGYNNYAFLMEGHLNQLMDNNGGGAPAQALLEDARKLGGHVASPFFNNLWRAMGRPDVAQFQTMMAPHAQAMVNQYGTALEQAAARGGVITGQDYERIMRPIVDDFWRNVPEEVRGARTAMETPSQLAGETFARDRIPMLPGGIAAWGKGDRLNVVGQVESMAPMLADMRVVPNEATDREIRQSQDRAARAQATANATQRDIDARRAAVLEQRAKRLAGEKTGIRKMEERAAADLGTPVLPQKPTPKTPTTTTTPKPTFRERYQQSLAGKQGRSSGMGLMGVGMLAQTAVMGLEMAGKEVPNAVEFATNGLMSIGMASMFFPGAMAKVTSGLGAVATGLGPWGLAIAAAAAVIGGTALVWRKINIDARERGNQYGRALADATYYANEVAAAYGNTSYVTEQRLKEAGTTQEELTTSQQFLESSAGKGWLKDNSALMQKIGPSMASSSLAMQVASWVVQGVMTTDNITGMVEALNQRSPGMGTQMNTQLQGLLGKKYQTKDMAALSNRILNTQMLNSNAAIPLFKEKGKQATEQTTMWDWLPSWLRPGKNSIYGAAQEHINNRVASEELVAAQAGVWSSQLKTAFTNRMAVEARLKQMVGERNQLAKKKEAGTATAEEIKNLKALQTQIDTTRESSKKFDDNIAAAFEQNKGMNALGNDTWYASQLDALRNMSKKDDTGLTKFMAESINDQKMLSDATQGAQGMNRGDANNALNALRTGVISPAAASNLTNFGTELARLPAIINALPAPKLQDFATQVGNMTGPQAQSALSSFGKRFMDAARAANLSGRETVKAAQALGAKEQVKRVRLSVKADKIKDPTAGIKDKNVKVGALTGPAENRLKKLKKLAEEASGKDIKIKANSNADGVIRKLREIIDTGNIINGNGVTVDTSTNAPGTTGKLQTLSDTIATVAGAGVINITANDEASIIAQMALDSLTSVQEASPNPTISVTSNAAQAALSAQASMNSVQDVTRHINIVTVKASGGLFADGGVHKGPGKVSGPGGPTDDKVNARLSDGEFVIRASSVNKYGTAFLNAVNLGMYEKQGYKKGTKPKKNSNSSVPITGTLPPKESDAKGRQADFNNEWRNIMWEAGNFIKEFKKMGKIINHGRAVLGKQFKDMDYEFGRWIMDNYDPKQIAKMFKGKKDKGAKKLAKQWQAEQKLIKKDEARQSLKDEIESQKLSLKSAMARDQLLRNKGQYGQDTPEATAIGNMSDEQMQMYQGLKGKKKTNFLNRLIDVEKINKAQADYAEKVGRRKEVEKSYDSATSKDVAGLTGSGFNLEQLSQWADDLGMSIQDLAEQFKDGNLPTNIDQLAAQAKQASKALEVLAMTQTERQTQKISNYEQKMSNLQMKADAQGRANVIGKNLGARIGTGNSQGELEARMAVIDAENNIKQAQIDDINEKYGKQLEMLDQINQQQQAISNLEKGRMTVANALSQGDIAAAAAAAQQQRSDTAAFYQSQMRTQIENQQKAQTQILQDQINAAANLNRDIQNQIALAIAQANVEQAAAIAAEQAKADEIVLNTSYIADMNAEIDAQNNLLSASLDTLQGMVTAAQAYQAALQNQPPPAETYEVPTGGGGSGGGNKPTKKKKKKKKAFGGLVPGIGNTDSVPIMATPGEFVVNKMATAKFGPMLRDMNYGGAIKGGTGGQVTIENIIFNINGANLNEREVADIAVRRMSKLDSATIRGGRF